MKGHTIGEILIKPACKEMVRIMIGNEAALEIDKKPMSNDTVTRRICCMSTDIKELVVEKMKNSRFTLQVNDSTSSDGKCYMIGFVRFVDDNAIVSQFLCLKELNKNTRGKDIFNTIDYFFENNGISWSDCVGICTDGVPSMTGNMKGFVTMAKIKNPLIIMTHCFIHREALMTKMLGSEFNSVLSNSVRMVNYIKGNTLKSRIFADICESMDADFTNLLYHTEVRWLSRGKVLLRLYELKEELLLFFMEEENNEFTCYLEDHDWISKFAYLADIFQYLNQVNSSLQGPSENILTSTDKLSAFQEKMFVWCANLDKGNTTMFPLFTGQKNSSPTVLKIIRSHLQSLQMSLTHNFPDLNVEHYDWIRNPFTSMIQTDHCEVKKEAVELKNDRTLLVKFNEVPLDSFWVALDNEYPRL